MSVKVRRLRTLKDGTVVWGIKIDHDGRRQQISIGSRIAAEAAQKKIELEIAKKNLGIAKQKKTSLQKVAADYLQFIQTTRSSGTYTRYKGLYTKFIHNVINGPIDEVTRGDVRNLLLGVKKQGYSRATIELVHTVLSGIFTHAMDDELVASMPTQMILKRLDMRRDRKKIHPLSAAEMDAVIDAVQPVSRDFFIAAYQTGARVGELCALTWDDVNFKAGLLTISKTAKDQKVQKFTKTHTAREIDISDTLEAMLIRRRLDDAKLCLSLGIKHHHIFHASGKILAQNTLRRHLASACRKTGIGHHTMHDIRHTTASILLSRGTPLLYVSQLLGHSSPKMTLDRYSHYMPSENKGMINSLDGKIKPQYKAQLNGNDDV